MAEDETKKNVIFVVRNKRIIFSDSAFPTFAEELESLYKDEDHHDEDETESDPPSAKASTTSSSLPDSISSLLCTRHVQSTCFLDGKSDGKSHINKAKLAA